MTNFSQELKTIRIKLMSIPLIIMFGFLPACGPSGEIDDNLLPGAIDTKHGLNVNQHPDGSLSQPAIAIQNPYKNYPYYYKGQTHAHSCKDGWENFSSYCGGAQEAELYNQLGYDFLALTDHDRSEAAGPHEGMIMMYGTEDGGWEKSGHHIIALDIYDNSNPYRQSIANVECQAARGPGEIHERIWRITDGMGGLAIIPHPNSGGGFCSEAEIFIKRGYHGQEVWIAGWKNEKERDDTPRWWDKSLSKRKKSWGFGADDHHKGIYNLNRAWIVVNSHLEPAKHLPTKASPQAVNAKSKLLHANLRRNIEAGNFYVVIREPRVNKNDYTKVMGKDCKGNPNDKGPQLKISLTGVFKNTIRVETDKPSKIIFIGDDYHWQDSNSSRYLKIATDQVSAEYTVSNNSQLNYVRVKVIQQRFACGRQETQVALSQPLFITRYDLGTLLKTSAIQEEFLVAKHSNKCLYRSGGWYHAAHTDISDPNTKSSENYLFQQTCGRLPINAPTTLYDHQFKLVPVDGTSLQYRIVNLGNHFCVTADQSSKNRQWLTTKPCDESDPKQKWNAVPKGSGYFGYRSAHNGLCLTVNSAETGDAEPITQHDCAYTDCQLWRRTKSLSELPLDGAFIWPSRNKAYFFGDTKYLRYDLATNLVDPGYPKNTKASWGNWPNNFSVQAAMEWNGKAYLFSKDKYLRYDLQQDRVEDGYPKTIYGHWSGWPNNFIPEAAVEWQNGKVYFFSENQYLRYDMNKDSVDPGYPKNIQKYWDGWPASFRATSAIRRGNKVYLYSKDGSSNHAIRFDMIKDAVEWGPENVLLKDPPLSRMETGASYPSHWSYTCTGTEWDLTWGDLNPF